MGTITLISSLLWKTFLSEMCILSADYLAEKRQAVAVIDADLQQSIIVQCHLELEASG